MQSVLLEKSELPFEAIAFDQIHDDDYMPALDVAIAATKDRVAAIAAEQNSPTFKNTIEALESADEQVDHVATVFFNLQHAHTNEKMQSLAKEIAPKLSALTNDIYLDEALFQRVEAVYRQIDDLNLSVEGKRLLEKTYKSFIRNGALLDAGHKEEQRKIDARLSVLTEQFGENVLKSSNAFSLVLDAEEELAGLPESVREQAAQTAKDKGEDGKWTFTLDMPSYIPFLKFSEKPELREKMWRAFMARALEGKFDNREVLREIAGLRHKRALLLGFDNHAHFVLEERMAQSPGKVMAFLERLLKVSKPAAQGDLGHLKELRQTLEGRDDISPWDVTFFAEKLKKKLFDLDENMLRPYFSLEKVVAGVFEHAKRLYGLNFKKREDLPVYHEDVWVYEVRDAKDDFVALFYADFFPRESKRNGAWATTFRTQGTYGGTLKRPHAAIVCNLTKPTPTKPSLLNMDEVETLFHEFGHALHMMLSKCTYKTLAGANVYWDFVELPSQIMENWVKEQESLNLFARHYDTGESIPADLVEKIKASAKFQAGYSSLRQLNFAFLDMAWHSTAPNQIDDVEAFEIEHTKETNLFGHEPGTLSSCAFGHIFAGGYAAGYYSYKWAEVLDADAFEYFKDEGIFNKKVADAFRENILEKGGSEHPMTLYKRFRGREPDPDALLRRDGLL